ncbi:hypothetical protein ACFY5D_17490 [Paeniglutamicibacter sp. NPDC012692]|uniref:hypothetical protein n=1 Tax=Paeniglutamicibacter sp. NPDC012692 TaxID=3364388 RepID=UPI0036B4BF4B
MIQQAFVELAEAVARGAHAGQVDKSGADYITHPARVLANPTALRVKRADIDDNTDPARTVLLPEATRKRLAAKYARTRHLLGLDTGTGTGTGTDAGTGQ